ncbi:MAG TPA: GGDEF domain-containing protein [Ideonella sp.]|nr:GGDEF domain-containing protein [Ideonella sp.]
MLRRVPREDRAASTLRPSTPGAADEQALPARPPAALRHLRRLVLRLGAVKSTLLVALVTSSSSLCITLLANALLPQPPGTIGFSLALSVGIPLTVAPPIAWFIVLVVLEAEAARRTAERLAMTDPLTGAYNRRHFFHVGEQALARALGEQHALSVLLLDIDHFKSVNDQHGHAFGDQVLNEVAAACQASLRKGDMLARFGGEEFVVLLPATGPAEAARLAERLRGTIAQLAIPAAGSAPIRPTVSIGVATTPLATTSLDKLLVKADQAMYLAKHGGRNRVVSHAGLA